MVGSVTDEIKQRVDVVEVISRYTELKRAGSIYKGLCPFHGERTPSFVVFPHSGTWHCFGACGTGGDVISFVMRKENLDFREAVEMLAKQAGIEIRDREEDRSGRTASTDLRRQRGGRHFFEHVLLHHPAAEPARRYLERRGIDQAAAGEFRLGFALDAWSSLRDHLLEQRFSLDLLLEAGVVKRSEERNSTFDMFRNRRDFPDPRPAEPRDRLWRPGHGRRRAKVPEHIRDGSLSQIACDLRSGSGAAGDPRARPGRDRRRLYGCNRSAPVWLSKRRCLHGDGFDARAVATAAALHR